MTIHVGNKTIKEILTYLVSTKETLVASHCPSINKIQQQAFYTRTLSLLDQNDINFVRDALQDDIKDNESNQEALTLLYAALDVINKLYANKTLSRYRNLIHPVLQKAKSFEEVMDFFRNEGAAVRALTNALENAKKLTDTKGSEAARKAAEEAAQQAKELDKVKSKYMTVEQKQAESRAIQAASVCGYNIIKYDEAELRNRTGIFVAGSSGGTNIQERRPVITPGLPCLHVWAWVLKDLFKSKRDILEQPLTRKEVAALGNYLTEMILLDEPIETVCKRRGYVFDMGGASVSEPKEGVIYVSIADKQISVTVKTLQYTVENERLAINIEGLKEAQIQEQVFKILKDKGYLDPMRGLVWKGFEGQYQSKAGKPVEIVPQFLLAVPESKVGDVAADTQLNAYATKIAKLIAEPEATIKRLQSLGVNPPSLDGTLELAGSLQLGGLIRTSKDVEKQESTATPDRVVAMSIEDLQKPQQFVI